MNIRNSRGRISRKITAIAAGTVIAVVGGVGALTYEQSAGAAQTVASSVVHPGTSTSPTGEYTICAKDSNNVPVRVYSKSAGCSTGYHAVKWDGGKKGDKGDPAIVSLTKIPATTTPVVLHNVGGSIRTGVTDLGATVLPDAGTYDVKALATFFRKVNTSSNPEWASKQTYGTLVLWTGDSINADFSNDTTVGGILIPKVNSTTLTIDPTADMSATITTDAPDTPVHMGVFAYNDDSSSTGTTGQPGEGVFSAALQSASFEELNVG